MKLNEIIDYKQSKSTEHSSHSTMDAMDRRLSEMKFEYESLQRSWKMHRDRLQEYVMAYRDAVAKLKNSYHKRSSLTEKLQSMAQENKKLKDSVLLQTKTFNATMEEAQ